MHQCAAMSPKNKWANRRFICCPICQPVSGEIHYVDVGYNTIGMAAFDDLKAAQSEDG